MVTLPFFDGNTLIFDAKTFILMVKPRFLLVKALVLMTIYACSISFVADPWPIPPLLINITSFSW